MILLVLRADISPGRIEEYRRFQQERCLPTLRRQPGIVGVLFLWEAEDRAASLTIWEDRGAVEALESSPSYRRTVSELAERELLGGNSSVEAFEVRGGNIRAETLVGALDRMRAAWPPESVRVDLRSAVRPMSIPVTEIPVPNMALRSEPKAPVRKEGR